jgi:hypothetical protein
MVVRNSILLYSCHLLRLVETFKIHVLCISTLRSALVSEKKTSVSWIGSISVFELRGHEKMLILLGPFVQGARGGAVA